MRRLYYVLAPVPLLWFVIVLYKLSSMDAATRAWTGGPMILPPLFLSFVLFWFGIFYTGLQWSRNKPVGWLAFCTVLAGSVCYYGLFRFLTNNG